MSQLNTDPKVRDEALKKALIVRRERAALKASVAQKELTFTEALVKAKNSDTLRKLKAIDLVKAVPGIGKSRSEALFVTLAISPKKRISGLSDRQYEALKSWGEKDKDKGKDK